jgi:hypothetical protein
MSPADPQGRGDGGRRAALVMRDITLGKAQASFGPGRLFLKQENSQSRFLALFSFLEKFSVG